MKRVALVALTLTLGSAHVLAIDGQKLINMATVNAAGGFPYQITQPGSYRLSGNLTVPAGAQGIEIRSDNVTLDLNGFAMIGGLDCTRSGPFTCTGDARDGIRVKSPHLGIVVRNGSVTGFIVGIGFEPELDSAGNFVWSKGTVEDISASLNYSAGIILSPGSVARRIVANRNGSNGIVAWCPSLIESTIALDNFVAGVNYQGAGCGAAHNVP